MITKSQVYEALTDISADIEKDFQIRARQKIASLKEALASTPEAIFQDEANLEDVATAYAREYTENENGNEGDDWENDIKLAYLAGAEAVMHVICKKLEISPRKTIGENNEGWPVYDFEEGHCYRVFSLFEVPFKMDQTDAVKAYTDYQACHGIVSEAIVGEAKLPDNSYRNFMRVLNEAYHQAIDDMDLQKGDKVRIQIKKIEP